MKDFSIKFSEIDDKTLLGEEFIKGDLLRSGHSTVILYDRDHTSANRFAFLAGQAWTIGKPFAGLVPSRALRVLVIPSSSFEFGPCSPECFGEHWKKQGWTESDIEQSFNGLEVNCVETWKKSNDFVEEVKSIQKSGRYDVIVLDVVSAFGGDPDNPSGDAFARFLSSGLDRITGDRESPCALVGLLNVNNGDELECLGDDLNRIVKGRAQSKQILEAFRCAPRSRAVLACGANILALSTIFTRKHYLRLISVIRPSSCSNWNIEAYGSGGNGYVVRNDYSEFRLDDISNAGDRDYFSRMFACSSTMIPEEKSL